MHLVLLVVPSFDLDQVHPIHPPSLYNIKTDLPLFLESTYNILLSIKNAWISLNLFILYDARPNVSFLHLESFNLFQEFDHVSTPPIFTLFDQTPRVNMRQIDTIT